MSRFGWRALALMTLPLLGACSDLATRRQAIGSAEGLPRYALPAKVDALPSEHGPAESFDDLRAWDRELLGFQDSAPQSATHKPSSPPSKPAEEAFQAKQGIYIGAALVGASLNGDFDGDSVLVSPDFAVLLPEADPGLGGQFSVGYRFEANAIELAVMFSSLDGVFHFPAPIGDASGDLDLLTVAFDWKHYFRTDERLQPFFLLGLNFEQVTVVDGGLSSGGAVGDGTLDGIGADLGGGASYYFTPQLSLNLQGVYRLDWMITAEGPDGDSETIDSDLSGSGWTLGLGVSFTF
jgi:opacity protein-like surface antigen